MNHKFRKKGGQNIRRKKFQNNLALNGNAVLSLKKTYPKFWFVELTYEILPNALTNSENLVKWNYKDE